MLRGLLSAEWALAPFEDADSTEPVHLVASSCALGGVSEDVLSKACGAWLAAGCVAGALGVQLAVEALLAWVGEP